MTTRKRDAVGAEKGDVERTREANNPNFIVGDLHSESHYQTSVPRACYNYAGVAKQKCIELPCFLSLSISLSSCFRAFSLATLYKSSLSSRSHVLYLHAFRTDHLHRLVCTHACVCLLISLSFRTSADYMIFYSNNNANSCVFRVTYCVFLRLTDLSLLMKITF